MVTVAAGRAAFCGRAASGPAVTPQTPRRIGRAGTVLVSALASASKLKLVRPRYRANMSPSAVSSSRIVCLPDPSSLPYGTTSCETSALRKFTDRTCKYVHQYSFLDTTVPSSTTGFSEGGDDEASKLRLPQNACRLPSPRRRYLCGGWSGPTSSLAAYPLISSPDHISKPPANITGPYRAQ